MLHFAFLRVLMLCLLAMLISLGVGLLTMLVWLGISALGAFKDALWPARRVFQEKLDWKLTSEALKLTKGSKRGRLRMRRLKPTPSKIRMSWYSTISDPLDGD